MQSDFDKPGDEDVFEKVKADQTAKAANVSDHQLRKQMGDLLTEAKRQVMAE